jgi:hypothetical protein
VTSLDYNLRQQLRALHTSRSFNLSKREKNEMKTLLSIVLAIALGTAAWAAQIGDTVEKNVPLSQGVAVPFNQPKVVAFIFLDDGVWDVTGLVNLAIFNIPGGNIYSGATISVGVFGMTTEDGHTIINTTPILIPTAVTVIGSALPSRTIDINGDHKPVFLASFETNFSGTQKPGIAWGFISARKIRNNH